MNSKALVKQEFDEKLIKFFAEKSPTKTKLAGIVALRIQEFGPGGSQLCKTVAAAKSLKYYEDVLNIAWGILDGVNEFRKYHP